MTDREKTPVYAEELMAIIEHTSPPTPCGPELCAYLRTLCDVRVHRPRATTPSRLKFCQYCGQPLEGHNAATCDGDKGDSL